MTAEDLVQQFQPTFWDMFFGAYIWVILFVIISLFILRFIWKYGGCNHYTSDDDF